MVLECMMTCLVIIWTDMATRDLLIIIIRYFIMEEVDGSVVRPSPVQVAVLETVKTVGLVNVTKSVIKSI